MAPRILYFPMDSHDALSRFRRLQQISLSNLAVENLLHRASQTLQGEASKIPSLILPEFRDVSSSMLRLAEHQDRHPWGPAQLALTLVAQLADLVILFTANSDSVAEGTPSSCHDCIPSGIGVGLLSAALTAVARDVWDVVQLSPYVVALGFRCAIDLEHRAQNIELSESSWQMQLTGLSALEDLRSKLKHINCGLPVHRYAYVGVVSLSAATATLFGPPSTLAKIERARDFPWHRSYMPCRQPNTMFAPHLQALDMTGLLQGVAPACLGMPALCSLHSPHDGKPYEAKCFRDLLAQVLDDIVGRCVDLDSLATSLAKSVSQSSARPTDVIVLGSDQRHIPDFTQAMSRMSAFFSFPRIEDIHIAVKTSDAGCRPKTKAVAVVGMAGRFPESDSVEELWTVLAKGSSTAKEIPPSRFSPNGLRDPITKEVSYNPSGHFIKNPGAFDYRLFAISPVEAMQMDPIQRMALTATYEALEMAGYAGSDEASSPDPARIAVYFGQTTDDWKFINQQRGIETHYLPGVNRSFTPGRISRYFGWSGPFYSIDTGCSSSATCLCLARDALVAGEIDMAVVGGGNLLAAPEWYEGLGKGGFLSKAGSCSTFAEYADGYCRGEAVAVVILKRQEDALNAKDNILATIAGAARNANARTSASMTAPSPSSQAALFRNVLQDAATSPSDVDYVEMHGTGTQSGDDSEMAAVANVFAQGRTAQRPLIVGAVKANIGHTEAAAGVVSLIKAILLLKNNEVTPQPGWPFPLNPRFSADVGQEIIISNRQSLIGHHRTILVNSFDAAGGNVSLVVQDAPNSQYDQQSSKGTPSYHIVVISGHSEASFVDFQASLHRRLTAEPNLELSNLSYATTVRRFRKVYRKSLVVQSTAQLIAKLAKPCSPSKAADSDKPSIIFTFTGQGSQYTGMGMTLYRTSPSFRRLLDSYERLCQGHGFTFLEVITQAKSLADTSVSEIQVATTALEIALPLYFISIGLVPSLVMGHSIGEYAALCVAGVLSVCDALWLVHQRARLMEQMCEPRTHGMLSVNLPALTFLKQWGENYEISCYNSPKSTVVSAPITLILDLEVKLKEKGVQFNRLDVDFAFHSSQIDPICASFEAFAEQVSFQSPKIPLASTLFGRIVDPGESVFNANYLARHARQAVNFVSAVQACEQNGIIQDHTVVVEIGPHPTNIGLIHSSLQAAQPTALATLRRGQDDWYGVSSCLAAAHDAGLKIKWDAFHEPYLAHLQQVALPQSHLDCRDFWEPFEEARLDIDNTAVTTEKTPLSSSLHQLHSLSEEAHQSVGIFYSTICEKGLANAIQGHVVDGMSICPTSVFMDMALSAATYVVHGSLNTPQSVTGIELADLNITSPLILEPHKKDRQVCIEARFDRENNVVFVHVMAANGTRFGPQPKYATCQILVSTGEGPKCFEEWTKIRRLVTDRCNSINSMDPSETCRLNRTVFYHMFAELVTYSDAYRTIQEATIPVGFRDASALFKFKSCTVGTFLCNPYMIDSVVHIAGFLLNADPKKQRDLIYISNRIKSFRMPGEISAERQYQVYASVREESGNGIAICDVYVFEHPFELLLSCEGIQFQRVERSSFQRLAKQMPASVSCRPKETQKTKDGGYGSADPGCLSDCSSSFSVVSSLNEQPELFDILNSVMSTASGLSAQEIESISTFGDMGIDSQQSISIMSQFKKRTGIDLPAAVFATTSNISNVHRELKALLGAQTSSLSGVQKGGRPKSKTNNQVVTLANGNTNKATHFTVFLHIVSDALGTETNDLDDSTTWQSLGLDPMQSIRILTMFKEQTGVELPAAYFLQNQTVADVRSQMRIEQEVSKAKKPLRPHLQEKTPNGQERAPFSRAILLQGSTKSQEPPLFLLTDGSGTVEAYIHLPALPNGRRTYGLESPFVDNPCDLTMPISRLASIFIQTIRSIQPRGPYFVGGWSVGGKYAFEVSRQLSLADDEIALLLILDTRPPRPRPLNISVEFGTLDDIGMTTARGKNLVDDFTDRERDHLYASCRIQSREQTRAFTGEQRHPRLCGIVWATRGLNEHADAGRHRAEVTRKAAMGDVEVEEDEIAKGGVSALRMIYKSWLFGKRQDFGANGWEKWVGGRSSVDVRTVEADHFSMVAPPDVYKLGEVIINLVEKAT